MTASDCLGSDSECQQRTCVDGVCGVAFVAAATPLAQQSPGDCHELRCDGKGSPLSVVDDGDVPDDGLSCTEDACSNGVLSHDPVKSGTSCGAGLICDGSGACVGCVTASDCTGTDSACQQRSCVAGVCGVVRPVSGTIAGPQTPGDCKAIVCDGQGNAGPVSDDSDAPSSNAICTLYLCVDGELIDVPKSAETSCSPDGGSVCDGSGACVGCVGGSNCASGVCKGTVCQPVSCGDGVKDGTETDSDCGGLCVGCSVSKHCSVAADCTSGVCSGGACVSRVSFVGGGDAFTCAARGDGAVKCWGRGNYGQLGLGDKTTLGDQPGEMGDSLPFVNLGTGRSARSLTRSQGAHVCATLDDGTLKCWGRNDYGQLGLGDTNHRGDQASEMGDALPTVNLGTGRTAKKVAVGNQHSCAILDNGSLKCWGRNDAGQLGLGDTNHRGDQASEMGDALPKVNLGTGRSAVDVKLGGFFTCALLDNASVKCWGYNDEGNLGLGDYEFRGDQAGEMGDSLPAVKLGTGRIAVSLGMADSHTCVLLDNKRVKCFGYGLDGRLGYGDKLSRGPKASDMGDNLPSIDVGTGHDPTSLFAGGNHMCTIIDGEYLRCWGQNSQGTLGLGDTLLRGDDPGEMGDALPVVRVSTEHAVVSYTLLNQHSCAILDDDTLKCWGRNDAGQLGLGDTDNRGDQAGEMSDALPTVSF